MKHLFCTISACSGEKQVDDIIDSSVFFFSGLEFRYDYKRSVKYFKQMRKKNNTTDDGNSTILLRNGTKYYIITAN